MLGLRTLAQKFFGTTNDRKVKIFQQRVPAINALEKDYEGLSDSQLKDLTTPNGRWACGISMSRWWAAWFCMTAKLPR
jgi:preprotein translocase subunit SecA